MIKTIVIALALTFSAASGGSAGGNEGKVKITVNDGAGKTEQATLRCPSKDQRLACRTITKLRNPDPRVACAMIYGGPQSARITGRINGKRVDLRLNRNDGCGISMWEKAGPVLRVASPDAGGTDRR